MQVVSPRTDDHGALPAERLTVSPGRVHKRVPPAAQMQGGDRDIVRFLVWFPTGTLHGRGESSQPQHGSRLRDRQPVEQGWRRPQYLVEGAGSGRAALPVRTPPPGVPLQMRDAFGSDDRLTQTRRRYCGDHGDDGRMCADRSGRPRSIGPAVRHDDTDPGVICESIHGRPAVATFVTIRFPDAVGAMAASYILNSEAEPPGNPSPGLIEYETGGHKECAPAAWALCASPRAAAVPCEGARRQHQPSGSRKPTRCPRASRSEDRPATGGPGDG